ncbi:hypothetical protein QBC44DRAFT_345292 [Cladorrhinum sp. PSN332]|nr:hypothetical protein QBC44DRAFT_345292 [Cladorrhinum sp. PSN332]
MSVRPHLLRLVTLVCFAPFVLARGPGSYGGSGGGGGGDHWGWDTSSDDADSRSTLYGPNSGNPYNPNSGGSGTGNNNNNNNGALRGPGFDIAAASHYRYVHGILAALAMVLLFPIGSILLRVLPGRLGVWAHAVFQLVATCIYIAGVGLGIYLVTVVRIPGRSGTLLSNPNVNYHPIIGLVLLALFLIQPVIGLIHHFRFRKVQKRQIWSYLHLFNGRVGVTIGIINGGLGLNLANASNYRKRVYIIVAAVVWVLWMSVAIVAELKRFRNRRKEEAKAIKSVVVEERRGVEYR